jgi:hypothetical protein
VAKKSAKSTGITPQPYYFGAPWRSLGIGASIIGAPFGISYLHPIFGLILVASEVAMFLIVIASALFGTSIISERAFRLLDWLAGKHRAAVLPSSASPPASGGAPDNTAPEH